jgi:pyruvate,orthophosphate dikinase
MGNRVVNIRLMDLPLHDFVPQTESDFEELCSHLSHLSREQIRSSADKLREHNPMLGLRACRFGLITPAVYDLQIRAIIRAAYASRENQNLVNPGIMFPLVFLEEELTLLKGRVLEIDEEVRESLRVPMNSQIYFRVGSMIELPAAALSADYLSRVGEFFAFGTNDLTQTTLGMSRDDSAHYLPHYLEKGLLGRDPFKILSDPVRELIEIAVRRGRRVRPDASFGICGEQGGDVSTLLFCLEKGLDYVSCSPFRVLPTRLALAKLSLSVLMASVRDESQTLSASYTSGIDPSPKLKRAG